jgi:2-keto-3-deoxy-6-phosphogluconate aldolase
MRAGCVAVGVGSSLLTADILAREDWSALTDLARQYVAAMAAARASR